MHPFPPFPKQTRYHALLFVMARNLDQSICFTPVNKQQQTTKKTCEMKKKCLLKQSWYQAVLVVESYHSTNGK